MDYRRKLHVFERAAWLRELKLLKAFTYRLLVQIQPSQQILKAITSQQRPGFCVMNWEAGIAWFGTEETEGRCDNLFQTRRNSCKTEGANCSPSSMTNGLNLQERSTKLCIRETWGTNCLGRQQSLCHFLREQVRLLCLRNDVRTVGPVLRPGERLHDVLKSHTATAWKRLQPAHERAPVGSQKQ